MPELNVKILNSWFSSKRYHTIVKFIVHCNYVCKQEKDLSDITDKLVYVKKSLVQYSWNSQIRIYI